MELESEVGLFYNQHLSFRVTSYLSFDFLSTARLLVGHAPFLWKTTNKPFTLCFLNSTAIICGEATVQAFRNGLLFVAQAITNFRRTSILFVSGLPEEDTEVALGTNSRLLRATGYGYTVDWVRGYLTNLPILILEYWSKPQTVLTKLRSKRRQFTFLENRRGIKLLTRFPDILCMLSVSGLYQIAFHEALKLRIATVAFVDTDQEVAPTVACIPSDDDTLVGIGRRVRLLRETVTRSLKRSLFAEVNRFETRLSDLTEQLSFEEMQSHIGHAVKNLPELMEERAEQRRQQIKVWRDRWVTTVVKLSTVPLSTLF